MKLSSCEKEKVAARKKKEQRGVQFFSGFFHSNVHILKGNKYLLKTLASKVWNYIISLLKI